MNVAVRHLSRVRDDTVCAAQGPDGRKVDTSRGYSQARAKGLTGSPQLAARQSYARSPITSVDSSAKGHPSGARSSAWIEQRTPNPSEVGTGAAFYDAYELVSR